MKAQTYILGSLDIIIVAEQLECDHNGNPRYDITLLSKNPSQEDFIQWIPNIPNYRRLKSNKYRSWSCEGAKGAIEHFWETLATWYYEKV